MSKIKRYGNNAYRLVVSDSRGEDGIGDGARVIEFEGSGAQSALMLASRVCAGREAEVFENGRSLGRIRTATDGGFWVIAPPLNPDVASSGAQVEKRIGGERLTA